MGKKTSLKHRNKKTIGHYFQLYVISVTAGLIVFVAGYIFLPTPPPCANTKTCQSDLSAKIENNSTGMFEGRKVDPPKIDLADDTVQHAVLGASDAVGEKHIYVDLSTQILYAYQGTTQVFQTFIASGKWHPTPVGNFHIWEKLRATRMAGGEGADAYNVPNVPYVMYFYQDFGIHGAYWHNNFGHQMSHGCVNMRIVDAKTVYDWADGPRGGTPGTAVSVCNSFSEPNNCIQNHPIN